MTIHVRLGFYAVFMFFVITLCSCGEDDKTSNPPMSHGVNVQASEEKHTNALKDSLSPYLLQHKHNPVDWVEWSEEAFAEAKKRDVPVLVSIGYATCHWCHVMAHESFEDEETAKIMNELYVCIKVDREQHPEVDEIYMDAVQALTGHGGWPLNAIVDHDGKPFFAGTYFPKPQWQNVLKQISEVWVSDRARIIESADEITAHLEKMNQRNVAAMPDDMFTQLRYQCLRYYDEKDHGIGNIQPKFPSSQLLPVLLSLRGDEYTDMHGMAEAILEAMQDAGIHDRVGGGFHRYSVDAQWRVPHFEKMLYDNAQLMGVYALAAQQFDRADFLQTAINTADYLLRDMRVLGKDGEFLGYASAEDADDPGGEGSFYAWSPSELEKVLGKEVADRLCKQWDIVAGEAHVGRSGHLEPVTSHIPQPRGADLKALAADGDVMALRASWEQYYEPLRKHRDSRPRPIRDDKILTDLNALALRGFALVARYSGEQRFKEACSELVEILKQRLTADGLKRLGDEDAFITDYGHLMVGLTDAFALLGDPTLIDLAEKIGQEAIEKLRAEDGGFYTTPIGRDDLVRRSREDTDNAYPSGIHSLALAFVRLYAITGNNKWKEQAEGIFGIQAEMCSKASTACATLLMAYLEYQRGHLTAVVTGDPQEKTYQSLLNAVYRNDIAGLTPMQVPLLEGRSWPALEGRSDISDLNVFVCIDQRCLVPAQDTGAFAKLLVQLQSEIKDK